MSGTATARASAAPPPAAPIRFFAFAGCIIMLVILHTLVKWIGSADFRPAPLGHDPCPVWLPGVILFIEALCAACTGLAVWAILLKPWLRDKVMPWDGMLMLAMASMWIQDPMCNYFNFTFMYNAHFFNMGSWSAFLPGWQSPRGGNLPEPLFLTGGVYLFWAPVNVITCCWILKSLRNRYPNLSMLTCLPFAFAGIVGLDILMEIPATRFGIFAYPGAPRALSLWAGEPYQFPIYANLLINLVFLSIALLRYTRDDKGESMAERGASVLRVPAAAKTAMRFLSLTAFCNLAYFIIYFMPYTWLALQADSFAHYPSYMLVDICGKNTPYACPSRQVPIPSRQTLAPIGPADPRLTPGAKQN